ncbi:unnamed protein product [Parascedosporium putredinis]|uniref:Uncharacterized protein n=1 Tax=Parascedosporium putredinis TaxID=1442378 RepID=A0A9P1MBT0_9PEZI|nr:unnamed protein product [Parascedosporium putredinis]CAI7996850.1 unnamed protein product [Parascedosporium putredinis]
MIRDRLPQSIDRPGKRCIRILQHPVDTPCTYTFGIEAMAEIWDGKAIGKGQAGPSAVDLALHMGMRPSYPGYCFETRARRDGYKHPGEDGQYFPQEIVQGDAPWAQLPEVLFSGFDIPQMLSVVGERLPGLDLKVSDNAGWYFCEFEFFSSLANALLKHNSKNALYLHVPLHRDDDAISTGARVAVEFITAAVEELEGAEP